ncbi:MAG: hypothetical protein AAF333_17135 [Planctomycetota bacterium]
MRRVVDILVVLLIAVVGVALWTQQKAEETEVATTADVQRSLTQLYERASYYGALENSTETTNTLWPVAVLPSWFNGPLPSNGLLKGVDPDNVTAVGSAGQARPWIDVAPPGDKSAHPPDPVAVRLDQAQFWYNPNIGVFRARVAATLNEVDALALYNQLNGVELAELLRDADPERVPIAYTPGHTPNATSLASRDTTSGQAATPQAHVAAGEFTFVPGPAEPARAPVRPTTPRQPSLFNPGPAATGYAGLEPTPEPAAPNKPIGRTRLTDVTK